MHRRFKPSPVACRRSTRQPRSTVWKSSTVISVGGSCTRGLETGPVDKRFTDRGAISEVTAVEIAFSRAKALFPTVPLCCVRGSAVLTDHRPRYVGTQRYGRWEKVPVLAAPSTPLSDGV
jgi:hypothetical protein